MSGHFFSMIKARGPTLLVKLGRRRILLVQPYPYGAYGSQLADILVGFYAARDAGAKLFLVPGTWTGNPYAYALQSREAPRIDNAGIRGWILLHTWLVAEACRRGAALVVPWLAVLRSSRGFRDPKARIAFRQTGATVNERRRRANLTIMEQWQHDLRGAMARKSITPYLPARLEAAARSLASGEGVELDSPLVAVHARESGYWNDGGKKAVRNSRIETYFAAIDWLVEHGYQVVRIGDPSMRSVRRRGVVDLATSPTASGLLELWCVMRSKFVITGCTGPNQLPWLLNVPMLGVNIIFALVRAYPLRTRDIYILKHVVDSHDKRRLSLTELVTAGGARDQKRYRYVDNTEEEILLAVEEMIHTIVAPPAPTPEQLEYRRLVVALAEEMGLDSGQLGDGYIAKFFAERHLRSGVDARGRGSGAMISSDIRKYSR